MATLAEVRAALEQEWQTFLVDRNAKGKLTQQGVWRRDNPGEWGKLQAYRAGGARPALSSQLGRQMVEHVDAYLMTGTPPPPTFVRVAPRVAYKAGNSDARYCLRDFPDLHDEVAHYDENGLCTDGRRSDGSPADCPTSALEIDGREYCSLPTQGDPTKNTGSWLI